MLLCLLLCVIAAGFHIDNSEPDPASLLTPQDLALSMLQLLFLTTRQLMISHKYSHVGGSPAFTKRDTYAALEAFWISSEWSQLISDDDEERRVQAKHLNMLMASSYYACVRL